jgi:hypothetical protein
MNVLIQSLLTNPFIIPLLIVFAINMIVFPLTFLLFRKLRSSARIKGAKWTAGGALAGFIIITGLELYLIDRFAPNSLEEIPSYQVVKQFYDHSLGPAA